MGADYARQVKAWADAGCRCNAVIWTKRPSAEEYPCTFVVLFESPDLALPALEGGGQHQVEHIALDVHYGDGTSQMQAGVPFRALGGLWMKAEPAARGDLKPEQRWSGEDAYEQLKRAAGVGSSSPDPSEMRNFGQY
jgi:hypothetical protein